MNVMKGGLETRWKQFVKWTCKIFRVYITTIKKRIFHLSHSWRRRLVLPHYCLSNKRVYFVEFLFVCLIYFNIKSYVSLVRFFLSLGTLCPLFVPLGTLTWSPHYFSSLNVSLSWVYISLRGNSSLWSFLVRFY